MIDHKELDEIKNISNANQEMHDLISAYYDASNMILLDEGVGSQIRLNNTLQDLADKSAGFRLIDLGCGTGNVLKLSKNFFKKIVGVDVSVKMLEHCRNFGATLLMGDINFIPFKNDVADVVTCFSVVHHLYQPKLLFQEIFRTLKPGGYFYSDNDPSQFATELHDLNKQSKLFQWLMGIYFLPLRFSKHFRKRTKMLEEFKATLISLGKEEVFESVSNKAEYHLKTGMNPYALKSLLEDIGFQDVTIYFHFRGKDLRHNLTLIEKLSLIIRMIAKLKFSFRYDSRTLELKELSPYFAILAKKPK
tara:strand:- start:47 stop:961 length:915 start_codon:yes stop_codon:yes gene_type:complete